MGLPSCPVENWPRVSGVKAFRRGLAGRFRIRTGDYRIQFRLAGQTVIVEKKGITRPSQLCELAWREN
jgi:mRNA-degrading endonuclease RelE of RelBE toxin-antitoxin system